MGAFVAIQSGLRELEQAIALKRTLLLFDRVGVVGPMAVFRPRRFSFEGLHPRTLTAVKPLVERGILFDVHVPLPHLQPSAGPGRKAEDDIRKELAADSDVIRLHELSTLRAAASRLANDTGVDAVAVLDAWTPADSVLQAGKERVVSVVLHQFPQPVEHTDWERILEYRDDPDARGKFFRLKNWINRAARDARPASEILDEINELLYEYQRYMKLHKIDTHTQQLQGVLTVAAEVIDNLLRLSFGKAVEAVFSLRQHHVALSEAELAAPGRELAYIIDVSKRFG